MIRAFMPLCVNALCSVAVGWRVTAVPPATAAAVAPAPVNCEKPTDPTMVPAQNSEADMVSQIEAWWAQKEAISQIEAWWAQKEVISQIEAWWRQRTELGRVMARTPVLPVQHRRHRGYSISPTEFVRPYDPGLGGSIKPAGRRELSDDELSAIGISRR
jgi:hypothetical protein